MKVTNQKLMECHHCGLLQKVPTLEIGSQAVCHRCDSLLYRKTQDCVQHTLALAISGIILFLVTNAYPFLILEVEGRFQDATLMTGIQYFYDAGMQEIAIMILLTCVVIPFFQLVALIYILLPMILDKLAPNTVVVFKVFRYFIPWSMIEVFLLGILISVIKLNKLAEVEPGLALWSYLLLIGIITLTFSKLNQQDIWQRLPLKYKSHPPNFNDKHLVCHTCLLTQSWHQEHSKCPRCATSTHYRKPKSLQRTTALVFAALILYIPANLMPITITQFLGVEQQDTIMSGVIFFMFSGSWHIALVIFIASVVIPLTKLLILVYLIIAVKYKVKLSPKVCTKLYGFTEAVGRWSMVDVYVVTVLVALVQLDPFAVIKAGPGVGYFAAVVVITMFAAESFDPRLLWDKEESS